MACMPSARIITQGDEEPSFFLSLLTNYMTFRSHLSLLNKEYHCLKPRPLILYIQTPVF